MTSDDFLRRYRERRDFSRTPEPPGGSRSATPAAPLFVVQKHAARQLHYDFRLEIGGVLKSWAVPKGPSLDPRQKRLAVPTEDHPLEYAFFEGVIPPGQYGAGTVMVWDYGTFRNLTEKKGRPLTLEEGLAHGHLTIWLEGKKLRGAFSLTRFKTSPSENWLLVKKADAEARPAEDILTLHPTSALSGRTLEEIAASGETLSGSACFH